MQKGRSIKLGKQESKNGEKEVDGSSQNSQGCFSQKMVQGEMGGCPIWKALRETQGRKARNALLQTIKACQQKNPCYCGGVDSLPEAFKNRTKEKTWSASRKAKES
jgi:hypothetical protein